VGFVCVGDFSLSVHRGGAASVGERLGMAKDEELTDVDWRTLCDTLRGSIAMFDMLLAECGDNSETARVVEAARRRREKVLEKIEKRLQG
jgi:hypothetical protein